MRALILAAALLCACSGSSGAATPTKDAPRYTQEQADLAIIQAGGACSGARYQGRGIWNCENIFTFDEQTGKVTGPLRPR